MVEVRFCEPGGWEPAGSLTTVGQAVVSAIVNAGVVHARLELEDGQVIEMRRSEPGGSVGPGAAAPV